MAAARDQLEAFDRDRTVAISAALDSVEEALTCRIAWLRQESQSMAQDIAAEFGPEYEEPTLRADLVEDWSRNVLLENLDRYYLAAIQAHAFLGKAVWGWLATLVRPALPRALVSRGGDIIDAGVGEDQIVVAIQSAPHLAAILAADRKLAHLLLRSLLLRQAFGGLVPDVSEQADVAALLSDATPELPGRGRTPIDWRKVWEHYTALAEMEAGLVCTLPGTAEPSTSRISEQLAVFANRVEGAIGKKLDAFGRLLQARDETTRNWQCAITARLKRLEAGLLKEYEDAPAAIKEACSSRVKRALGPLFDRLADDTRHFLEAAEWVYSEAPAGLDRSLVIVGFTKAFETELWHALYFLQDRLQQSANTRPYKKKLVTEFSLGELARLLRDNSPVLKPRLDKLGLAYSAVLEAIGKVNREVPAKHREARGEAEARSFRALFLDTPSVLAAVCPPKRTH
jgi:hypothetical protein